MSDIIIKMTPFIFEDGNTYYFEINKRNGSVFHGIYVYKKVVTKRKFLWVKSEKIHYELINKTPELVDRDLDIGKVKYCIKKIITAKSANHQIKGWDGFVGNVPEDLKKSILRDSKLNDLFNE